ncbi:hypothetical protein [Aggregatibacter actinomycetemcomitans]|uniref:hypothetical protein n=1 Tax=Aggregatibacter actinomycetemcomitans TaxID=714 RepID=UPI000240040C|nr:hypothetical protein [Aggregatibacter actinomycetemcomitans]EHK90262.1 hypothetical protein RHAA1_05783 [Aggregatibacter actinomycetemcomitans RhAA1]
MPIYKITHYYDKRPEYSVKIVSKENPKKIAVYVQFMAEKWFDESICLDNLVIADVLIKFYGCRLPNRMEFCQKIRQDNIIDMHVDTERLCGEEYHKIMGSDKYIREGLKAYLSRIQEQGNYTGKLIKTPKYYTDFNSFKNLSIEEQEKYFDDMRKAIQDTEERENHYCELMVKSSRESQRFGLTLQIALLYLFNRNNEKDKILSHFIQDSLIDKEKNNQPEDIIKFIQEHYIFKNFFIGDLKDNKNLEKRMIDFLINNQNSINV